ncbi:hypothetical protein NKI20_28995 [Mesorhizobium sp. M0830]|uniref:hypothetical protein n=1 Tax=Mesorhizobium sp. M0830 TaxID=2957008 RepID=UPI003337ECD6
MTDTVIDLSGGTTSATLTDGTILTASPQGDAGTGNYDTFLVLGAQDTESGFNTDGSPLPLDDKQQEHTNALLLSSMQVVTVGGHDYYVFKLDANEPNSATGSLLSLDSLKIYSATDPNITDLSVLQSQPPLYDMDGNGNVTVQLNAGKDAPAGSGQGDLFVYIPTSFFTGADNYIYLYSAFGTPSGSDGGFEEWGVITGDNQAPTIAIEKTADPTSINEGVATQITYTYAVTNTSLAGPADPLTLTSLVDDNATPGNPGDDIDLLNGFVTGSTHGTHYVSGDTDGDYRVDSDEIWIFNATVSIDAHNAGSIVNTVVVHGHDDDSLTDVTATDTATVTVKDVAPSIAIEKTADPISINEGSAADVTYTYEVTNTSAAGAVDPLTLTALVDDNATPGDTSDDIDLLDGFVQGSEYGTYYESGDTDGDFLVDSDEKWVFKATVGIAAHNAGSIVNTVVVHGHDDDSLTDVTATDTATVTVKDVAPSVAIDKTVDANHDGIFNSSETVQSGAQNATYHYAITNTSPAGALDPLTLTSLVDDNGTANTGDDIDLLNGFVANSSHGTHYVSGDTNGDYLVDTGETWLFTATSAFNLLPNADFRTNTVEVAAHDDDSLNEVTAQDTATVSSFAGPGVRTPGFWSNLGKSFWDGIDGVGKTGPNFADHELRYQVDSNNDGNKNGSDKSGLLIGDYDKNGLTGAGEDTFFISYADALKVIDASSKDLQDTRFVLARDAVATWLNYLAGNPIGDATDPNSPHKYLDQAIDWLQVTNGGTSSSQFEDWGGGSGAVKASSAAWNVGLDAESSTSGSELAGNLIHQELDFYNNTGMTFEGAILHIYANDGG